MQGHRIEILGNLGQDPEMRYTQGGTPVTNFSVAANRKWSNADGELQEETVWFRVSCWRKLAENCNEYLRKGSQVLVDARMRPDPQTGNPRIWTGRDGDPRASYEVTAQDVRFLGGNGGQAPDEALPEEEEDGELPF